MTDAEQSAADDLTAWLYGVQRYCRDNYSNGWSDLVVETMSDDELRAVIKGARTLKGAIKKARNHFCAYSEQRRAVQNEIF